MSPPPDSSRSPTPTPLCSPARQEVYYNGENINNESGSGSSGYFPEGGASDPKDSAMGALGGNFDTNVQNAAYSNLNITNLVDIRNRYGRGNYRAGLDRAKPPRLRTHRLGHRRCSATPPPSTPLSPTEHAKPAP